METTPEKNPRCRTRLRATESDLRPLNLGPSYAWKKAASREHWRLIVDKATLLTRVKNKKVKFSHTRYRALGPKLIPVYRQSARRWREVNHAIDLAVGCR